MTTWQQNMFSTMTDIHLSLFSKIWKIWNAKKKYKESVNFYNLPKESNAAFCLWDLRPQIHLSSLLQHILDVALSDGHTYLTVNATIICKSTLRKLLYKKFGNNMSHTIFPRFSKNVNFTVFLSSQFMFWKSFSRIRESFEVSDCHSALALISKNMYGL